MNISPYIIYLEMQPNALLRQNFIIRKKWVLQSGISRITDEAIKMMTVDPDDWRTPLVYYLENPSHIPNRKVWRQALKYVVLDNTLCC
jgi:hypothetical protein